MDGNNALVGLVRRNGIMVHCGYEDVRCYELVQGEIAVTPIHGRASVLRQKTNASNGFGGSYVMTAMSQLSQQASSSRRFLSKSDRLPQPS